MVSSKSQPRSWAYGWLSLRLTERMNAEIDGRTSESYLPATQQRNGADRRIGRCSACTTRRLARRPTWHSSLLARL